MSFSVSSRPAFTCCRSRARWFERNRPIGNQFRDADHGLPFEFEVLAVRLQPLTFCVAQTHVRPTPRLNWSTQWIINHWFIQNREWLFSHNPGRMNQMLMVLSPRNIPWLFIGPLHEHPDLFSSLNHPQKKVESVLYKSEERYALVERCLPHGQWLTTR